MVLEPMSLIRRPSPKSQGIGKRADAKVFKLVQISQCLVGEPYFFLLFATWVLSRSEIQSTRVCRQR